MNPTQHKTPLFRPNHALVGMVHARALPGAPRHAMAVSEIVRIAVHEAKTLASAGFDAVIVENMHDVPYLRRADTPETIAAMTRIVGAVVEAVQIPVGLQILSHANSAALAIAHITGARFIRAEGFVFSAVSDEGIVHDACAGSLMRDRARLGASDVRVWADLRKKHSSHALTADLTMTDWVHAAQFFDADALIITGRETGDHVDVDELTRAVQSSDRPVYVGSGSTPDTLNELFKQAHGAIVGSAIKVDGYWANELDSARIRAMVSARDTIACARRSE
ncbi:MAG: BtpA/SgcQ family protein [Planctomycetota bacterium]|nr:BtpA/SgcQ family protein [Planctomycetota bacterium]